MDSSYHYFFQQQQQLQLQQQQQQQLQLQQQQQQQQQLQLQQQQQQQPPTTPRPLQGTRPAPLQVAKGSYKIKKPPAGPAPSNRPPRQQPQPQRQPVIIYAVSPKVIHTKPSEFMSLVQRLTGVNSSPSAAAAASSSPLSSPGFPSPGPAGAVSPAAKFATIEKAQHVPYHHHPGNPRTNEFDIIDKYDAGRSLTTGPSVIAQSNFMGILSPNPASLPGISPNLFSSGSELNSLGFLHDIFGSSPAVNVNRNFIDSTFLTSPNFPFTPTAPSPTWDLFSAFPDL